jgi:hypothetical protein
VPGFNVETGIDFPKMIRQRRHLRAPHVPGGEDVAADVLDGKTLGVDQGDML